MNNFVHCLSNVVWHLTVYSNRGTFHYARLSISRCSTVVLKEKGSCLKWLEILVIYFKCNRNSYLRTNQEVKNAFTFIVFGPSLQVLCHNKNMLELINASKMKNVFILTGTSDKTLSRGREKWSFLRCLERI